MIKQVIYSTKKIHYRKTGQGPAVMLVHGFGEDGDIWNEFTREIENKFTLLIPDLPGSGESEALTGKPCLEDFAEILHTILQFENIEKVAVIGHSMGGYIALAFAEKYPMMLTGLGLFQSSAYADDEVKKQTRSKAIEFIQSNSGTAFMKTSLPGLFQKPEKFQKELQVLLTKAGKVDSNVLVQYYEAMKMRPDRRKVLTEIDVPVLHIMGEHDKAVPFSQSLEQCQLSAISYVYILRNSAHMGMLEEKQLSLSNLLAFLHDNRGVA